jgi:nitrogen fixation NifU-like protein
MESKPFDFLQHHSPNYLKMALSREREGTLANPDGYGQRTGDCQDTVELFLEVINGQIRDIAYRADGCLNTHACANTVAKLAQDKPVSAAWDITPEQVIEYLETLPEDEHHCAELAVGAFYRALADYQDMQKAPWKKQYRRKL